MDSRKIDALMAVGALWAIMAGTYANLSWAGPGERPLDPLGVTLIVVSSLSLAWRRTAPLGTGLVAVACGVVYYSAHYPGVFAAEPALAAIYTLASLGRRKAAIGLAAAFAIPVYGLMALAEEDPAAGNGMTLLSGWLVAMVVVGEVVRSRRAYLRAVEQRAEEAERTREEAALRRAGQERLWIAQELHDSLTHSISVVNVQVAVAMQLLDRDPARAREALAAIKESGHEAMRELRATLGAAAERPRGRRGGARRAAAPGGQGRGGGAAGVLHRHRHALPGAARGGSGRLPDRPGGADQRAASCGRGGLGRGRRRLRSGGDHAAGGRRRRSGAGRDGNGTDRDARARGRRRRVAHGGPG
jgi:hypothetical protein